MPVGVTRDHLELASTMRAWAADLGGPAAVREAETDAAAAFAKTWQSVVEMGLTGIGIDEQHGGGGGDLLDQMVALEAAAYAMVPGPLLGTTLVGQLVDGCRTVLAVDRGWRWRRSGVDERSRASTSSTPAGCSHPPTTGHGR